MKITVVGAGNVGATCADVLAHRDAAHEIVLVDIKPGIAEGKALDIWQSAPIDRFNSKPTGVTNNYLPTANSQVVVITSGLPRKPGMSRDDLIETNATIVKSVTEQVIQYSPCAVIIVVSNPLDVMTYQAYLTSQFPRTRVIGMAGVLDAGRYKAFIADELNVSPKDISALLLGGHGDTMVPLPRYTTVAGIPVTDLLPKAKIDAIIERTRFGGGELVKLMGTSAWYAPGSAAARMAEAITRNHKRVFPCCVKLEGEYGLENVFIGVPVVLGKNGVERILELNLTEEENLQLSNSAKAVKEMMEVLDNLQLKNR
ncbi:MAG TPA: malate dehydrogenase [Bacteroidales bacterium]|nr:malate dehydrogenase [Bacteroidales bacterium]